MLKHVSSREMSQWFAYEQVAGPVGPIYERAVLRQIACSLNGDEKAKPFPSPVDMARYRPQEVDNEGTIAALNLMIPEG